MKYKLIIGGETVIFDNPYDMAVAIDEAEKNNISVVVPDEGSEIVSNEAPESEFGKIINQDAGSNIEEDFTTDPVESADAASTNAAQGDTGSSSENTFSASSQYDDKTNSKSVEIKGQSYAATDVIDSLRKGDIRLSGRIGTVIYKWKDGKNTGQIKDNISDDILLEAYTGAIPGAKIVDGFSGGKLDEVVLAQEVVPSEEGGANPFGSEEELSEDLYSRDWDEQKDLFQIYADQDPNMSVEWQVYGAQETPSKGRSKHANLIYTDPTTGEISYIKIKEGEDPSAAATKLIDFSNKKLSYEGAAKFRAKKTDRAADSEAGIWSRIGEDMLDSNLTEFANPKTTREDFAEVELQEGVDKSWAINPFRNEISGRDINEQSKDPEFIDSVISKITAEYESTYPGRELPGDQFMRAFAEAGISQRASKVIANQKYEDLQQRNYLLEQGEYFSYLDKAFQLDIDAMDPSRAAAASNVNAMREVSNRLRYGSDNNETRVSLMGELDTLKRELPALLKAINKDYKPYLDPATGSRVSKATFEELKKNGEEGAYEDASKQDKALTELYNSMPLDKLEFEYFSHQLNVQRVKEAFNQKISTIPGKSVPAEIIEAHGLVKNKEGGYDVTLKNYTQGVPSAGFYLLEGYFNDETKEKARVLSGYLLKDTADMMRKDEALQTAFLLNIDPTTVDQGAGDVAMRALEVISTAIYGEERTTMVGTSARKELDELESLMTGSDIVLSNEEKTAFTRGTSMHVLEGVSAFAPELVKFAVANKVQGALGITKALAGMVKAGQTLKTRVIGHALGAITEELKFKAVTLGESHTGGGAGFYLGGTFMRYAFPFRFTGRYAGLNPTLEKVGLGGIGGAVSSEVAAVTEGMYKQLKEDGQFDKTLETLYGKGAFNDPLNDDKDTGWFQRFVINTAVFGLIGGTNMKKYDFYAISRITRKSNELHKQLEDHLKGIESYTEKELKEKNNLLDLLDYRLVQSRKAEYKKEIGAQVATKKAAQEILDTGKVLEYDNAGNVIGRKNASFSVINAAKKTIADVNANIASTQRNIERQVTRFVKADILSELGYKLENIEVSDKPLSNGDKAQFITKGKTISVKIDINKFKPGVFGHEMGHLFAKLIFKENKAFATEFQRKLESTVSTALKDTRLSVKGKGRYTFKEAMEEAYGKENSAEEYMFNVLELLGSDANRHVMLEQGFLTGISRDFRNMRKKAGIPFKLEKNYETASDLIEFLNTFRETIEGGNTKAIRNTFEAFKNIIIDGKKLTNLVGSKIETATEVKETLDSSKDIDAAEKQDIFSKATRGYEDIIAAGGSPEQAGVMVGYEMQPLVKQRINSYLIKKGLEIKDDKDAIIEDLVSDVTTSIKVLPKYNQKGELINNPEPGTGIPTLVQAYIKGANLIKYLKENPNATSAEINEKAEEFGVKSHRVQSFVDLVKDGGEATMTSYVFGQLNNRILASMQKPRFRDIFNTFSLDKDPTRTANIAEGEGLGGGGANEGYVDISSPELNTRINTLNAQVTLKIPENIRKEITEVGPKIALTVPLKNIDAKTEGQVILPDGEVANVVISKNDRAVINIEGRPTDVVNARSPKIIEKKLGTAAKSFVKTATTKERLTKDAVDLIYPKLEKVAGALKDNYTATQQYAEFIDNAFPLLKNYISQSAVNKRFKEFKEPVIDKDTGKQKREKTAAGKPIFTKKNITLAEWRKYFIGDGGTRIDGRRRSVIEALSSELGFDSVMEALSTEAMRKQVESRQEDIGVELVENYVAMIAKEFDRGNTSKQSAAFMEVIKKGGYENPEMFLQKYSQLFEEGNTKDWETLEGAKEWIEAVTRFLQPVVKAQIDRRVSLNEKTGKNEGETVYTKFEEQAIKYGLDPKFAKIIANFNENIAVKFDKDGNIISSNQKTAAARKNELDVDFAIRELLKGIDPEFTKITQGNYYYESTEGGFLAGFFKHTSRYVGDKKYSNKTIINEAGEKVQVGFKNKFEKELSAEPEKQTELDIEIQERTRKLFEDIKKNETTFIKETGSKKSGYTLSKQISDFRKSTKLILNGAKVKFKNAKGETVEIDYNEYTAEQKAEAVFNQEGREATVKDLKLKQEFMEIMLLNIGNTRQKIAAQPNSETALERFDKGASAILFAGDGKGIRMFSFEQYFQIGQKYKVKFKNEETGEIEEKLVFQDKNEHIDPKLLFTIQVLSAMKNGELTSAKNVKSVTEGYKSIIGSKRGQKVSDFFTGTTITDAKYLKMILATGVSKMVPVTDIMALKSYLNIETGKTAFQEMITDITNQVVNSKVVAEKRTIEFNNENLKGFGLSEQNTTTSAQVSASKNIDKAFEKSKDPNKKPKGISVFDFDDTLAKTKSNVLYTLPNGTKGKLNATEFAKKSEALEAKGAEFDFSEFSKVMKGELGPLFSEAKKKEGKYTNKDIFILTARPSNSALAIMEFLKSEGLEIPIENIVGLGNGAAAAKANWMIGKVAEGYNDFYFADDAIKNVEAVKDALSLFDIKSEVQQAIMRSADLNLERVLGKMIERKKGIPAKTKLSPAIASNMGKKKGRYDWFIPPAAEDFAGLMYKFYSRGEQGNKDMAVIKETLIRPFNRAENAMSSYRNNLGKDYDALEKQLGDMKVVIKKDTKANLEKANINADQATRVFIYDKLGYDIPGLKKNEIDNLISIVNADPRLKSYAEGIMKITKTDKVFPEPGETWYSSNVRYELFKYATEGVRGEFLKEWQTNVDKMFSSDNMSKIEAGYGKNYTENLKEILSRMKTGKTRSSDLGKDVQAGMDYVNGSVGVIMFLNSRSAVLQTISAINFVNWSDNNPLAIGKSVLKPKEWGKTFLEIFNSDFLQQRRGGLEINVEESEIAKAVERSKGNARVLYDGLIKVGFLPTQIADSFAIAFGGAPFLMNRTNTYLKAGLTPRAAKARAFEDFRETAEESQQSSRQDRVSNIQTGVAGRLIFAFANTPMQMSRMVKKATLDLAYGRGDRKTNISKMIYYSAVQSYIFYSLQQSQFLRLFGGDEEDMSQEEKDFNASKNQEKNDRIANSMFDSFISGSGSPGKVAITAKNTVLKYLSESEKGYKADYGNVINEALSISPPLSSKTKKVYSALKTKKYYSTEEGKKELEEFGQYSFDNPMLMAKSKVFSAITNLPADRLLQKANNLYSAYTDETLIPMQRAALAMGWDKWSLGMYDDKFMTEEEVATNKAARKEKLKKEKAAKKKAIIDSYDINMGETEKREILEVLTKKEQGDSLWQMGQTRKQIRLLTKESDRIEKIISLQNLIQFNKDMIKISNTTRQDSLK